MSDKLTYKDSGVDIKAGAKFVEAIKKSVKSTYRDGVIGDLGGFGGLFKLGQYKEPILVSGTDGVGTKLKVAFMMDKHDTIGIDAVAMCVNDIVVLGAEPLFFLDYLATGNLEVEKQSAIVEGIADGCKQSGCALIGGETAEMPGFYNSEEYDIAGFSVGVVEKDEVIDGKEIEDGDIVLGLASSGIHSNGYSLVRKLFFDKLDWKIDRYVDELGKTLGEEILTPTKIYVKSLLNLKKDVKIKGLVHITGGGFIENIPRILPENVDVEIEKESYEVPAIFKLMQKLGNIEEKEMYKTFNMGIGMAVIIKENDAEKSISILEENGEKVYKIGRIVNGKRNCKLV
ncbi:phosphoribosylformylglycinamidine cyclo-ligase [Haliovirga abyssi]|uniref:Phosphoribosylformylglycinamidine cyclo-ligase n=1 Tax=Haliovirga abyssi TaxID=2996794 RepID=A0AAU9DWN3_9FUSO|nr:phosphoribosylformylglycinamidine cyclo-ligase [Haliovirga abyssi]BDU50716.1 phosphoribosylformylglycinamidine cyclo-ligase [Haliovirga abyssi]